MNILLIEPDSVLGRTTKSALEAAGWMVGWERSAQKALDHLEDKIPDLIVLELQLGLHNGIEFLYEIRSYIEWQNLPVIVYSINPKVQDVMFTGAFEQLGVKATLYKPSCTIAKLVTAIKNL